jgi:hypothetical protein
MFPNQSLICLLQIEVLHMRLGCGPRDIALSKGNTGKTGVHITAFRYFADKDLQVTGIVSY